MTDQIWDSNLPAKYKSISTYQWTPVQVIEFTWQYLQTQSVSSILDLGSGVGKFCLYLAKLANGNFPIYGIEDRLDLYKVSESLKTKLKLEGVVFNHEDFLVNFPFGHSHYYLFNPLYETMKGNYSIDFEKEKSANLFLKNLQILKSNLLKCKTGTKVITYHGFGGSILPGFRILMKKELELGEWMVWERD
ncbi:methyltransferase [Leptospira sp. WS39.C2]